MHSASLLVCTQGTLMAVLICGLGLWATLVLSARSILSESILNFPLVIVMGIALIMIFILICAHFRSLLNEFATGFYMLEVLLFATIPLLSSVIISWFLCVEIPFLDLSFCFSTVYFAYTLWLGMPRRSSHPSSFTSSFHERSHMLTMPRNVLMAVYAVPVIFTPLLHLALCHNVLVISSSRISGIVISILFPLLLMTTCLENHTGYWREEDTATLLKYITNVKLICSALLFVLVQSHPVLDDLKKLSNLPASYSSALLCGIAMLMALVVYLHRMILIQFKGKRSGLDDCTLVDNIVVTMTGLYVFSSMCAGCCGALFAIFLGLSPFATFLAFEGAMAANNFYRYSSSNRPKSLMSFIFTYGIPVLLMIFAARVVLFNFLYKTIVLTVFQLDFELFPMSMMEFCSGLDQLVVFAVSVPTIVKALSDTLESRGASKVLLPVGVSGLSGQEHVPNRVLRFLLNILFPFLLIKFNIFMMLAELVVREQVREINRY